MKILPLLQMPIRQRAKISVPALESKPIQSSLLRSDAVQIKSKLGFAVKNESPTKAQSPKIPSLEFNPPSRQGTGLQTKPSFDASQLSEPPTPTGRIRPQILPVATDFYKINNKSTESIDHFSQTGADPFEPQRHSPSIHSLSVTPTNRSPLQSPTLAASDKTSSIPNSPAAVIKEGPHSGRKTIEEITLPKVALPLEGNMFSNRNELPGEWREFLRKQNLVFRPGLRIQIPRDIVEE